MHRVCINKFRALGELNGPLLHNNDTVLSRGRGKNSLRRTSDEPIVARRFDRLGDRKSHFPFLFSGRARLLSFVIAPMSAHRHDCAFVPPACLSHFSVFAGGSYSMASGVSVIADSESTANRRGRRFVVEAGRLADAFLLVVSTFINRLLMWWECWCCGFPGSFYSCHQRRR